MTELSVTQTGDAGVYRFSAVITDLQTTKVLAKPVLLTKVGMPATVELGAQPGVVLRFVVTVANGGHEASYRSEVVRNGKVESAQSGLLSVKNSV